MFKITAMEYLAASSNGKKLAGGAGAERLAFGFTPSSSHGSS